MPCMNSSKKRSANNPPKNRLTNHTKSAISMQDLKVINRNKRNMERIVEAGRKEKNQRMRQMISYLNRRGRWGEMNLEMNLFVSN